MSVAMQGNTLNDLGNDSPPSRELYEKYPPTIAGSFESMSFPAETRSVGIWTRSMEGSWCVVCYLGKLVGAAGQHVANWRDSIMVNAYLTETKWLFLQSLGTRCMGMENKLTIVTALKLGPQTWWGCLSAICHGPVVYTIHTFLRPSCIKQAAWGMLFSQVVSLLCSTFVNMVPFTFFPGAGVRFDLNTYIIIYLLCTCPFIHPFIPPSSSFLSAALKLLQ